MERKEKNGRAAKSGEIYALYATADHWSDRKTCAEGMIVIISTPLQMFYRHIWVAWSVKM